MINDTLSHYLFYCIFKIPFIVYFLKIEYKSVFYNLLTVTYILVFFKIEIKMC